jgi:hypothetical protein
MATSLKEAADDGTIGAIEVFSEYSSWASPAALGLLKHSPAAMDSVMKCNESNSIAGTPSAFE